MDLALDDKLLVSSWPKKGTGPFFKFFRCSNYFYGKKCISRDAYSGLDLSIYVIKSLIQLVRQSHMLPTSGNERTVSCGVC
jgi:hypothetical protein